MVRNVSAPVPKVFLKIKYSSPKFQNNVLPGIKATILRHKEVSSILLLEAFCILSENLAQNGLN